MTDPMLLREVIEIPEAVHKGDLVFQLAEAADDAEATAASYVVTDQLVDAFDRALGLVQAAVRDNASKGAYLHGSFGSGKSNFMGVLQLLLDRHPAARRIPELAGVVKQLDTWQGDKRFLTVPFHLVGATDLESAVFGRYVAHLAKVHPDAPPPAVYADEPILANADELRASVGDDAFFAKLSAGAGDGDWGSLSAGWTAETYDAARHAPGSDPERQRLVQGLLATWLPAFAEGARANKAGYVDFADGLAAISAHAAQLGYAGVVLFLDELILWFMSRLGDLDWVAREAAKLSLLVEAPNTTRPAPIISIIARQRDLRDLVGDDISGDQKTSFGDQLDHQSGRFGTITLDDSNLPVVAHKRLLAPVSDDAATTLANAFDELAVTETIRAALLGDHGTQADFALTYPFSPAFMTVLVDVAGALQRTRTGLRVLLELLVRNRDQMLVGQLVPVGDLYDVLESGDDPFNDIMRGAFDRARAMYAERLRPALRSEHGLDDTDAPTDAFLADDRLIKTLLLAALVPNSPPFKNLTVERLVALNHGLISSPLPGQETAIVINKLRKLATRVGELRIGDDPNNPSVAIMLSDIDAEAILERVAGIDNLASRRTLIRTLVSRALGLPVDQLVDVTYPIVWRGLRRNVEIHFGNLRDETDLPDSVFANTGTRWKLLIDFPFDPEGTPNDDLARIEDLAARGQSWRTLCWNPSFFNATILSLVGRLVRLNHVLANDDRYNEATSGLSSDARARAKPQLESMQHAIGAQLDQALRAAYGTITDTGGTIDDSHALADHFPTLRTGLTIAAPTQPALRDALDQVLDQAFTHDYPGAPDFDREITAREVRKVAELCADAVVEPDGRLLVDDRSDRMLLMRIANPLDLGVQSEQAFTLQRTADRWDATFTRAINAARADGAETVDVGLLRTAINTPKATGLTAQLENLIILVWAQATNHTFRLHGGPVDPDVDRLADDWVVVAQDLPTPSEWDTAKTRIGHVFGETVPAAVSGFALERAGKHIATALEKYREPARALIDQLTRWCDALDISVESDTNERLRTARCAASLIASLDAAEGDLARVRALAEATLEPSPLAVGTSLESADTLIGVLTSIDVSLLAGAARKPGGADLARTLTAALTADELVTHLADVLGDARTQAVALLTDETAAGSAPASAPPAPGPEAAPPGTEPAPSPGGLAGRWEGTDVGGARGTLDKLETKVADGDVDAATIRIVIEWDEPSST